MRYCQEADRQSAFNEVEPAPPAHEASDKLAQRGNSLSLIGCTPEEQDSHERPEPDHRMEEAIPDHIHVHGCEGRRGQPVGEHLVPLQDLMQDNAIDKASQADAEDNPCTLRFPVRDACLHTAVLRLAMLSDAG